MILLEVMLMKWIFGLVFGLVICGALYAGSGKKQKPRMEPKWRELAKAVGNYESGFGKKLVGDNGAAIGFLHIHKQMVDEVNRILALNPNCALRYRYHDRKDREKSIEMFCIYMQYWWQKNPAVKAARTLEDVYRAVTPMWNMGPDVDVRRNLNAKEYWRRVRVVILNMRISL
jgi:hypothetical protein